MAAKNELVKSQVEYAKESIALQEVLQQIRDTLNKQAMVSLIFIQSYSCGGRHWTRPVCPAQHLGKDNTLPSSINFTKCI